VTFEELKGQVRELSSRLDVADVSDSALLKMRIELRQLLNQLDVAAVPVLENVPLEVDVDALLLAVDRDIEIEAKRANLIVQVGKVISFVKKLAL
jgi:hypothetical protein